MEQINIRTLIQQHNIDCIEKQLILQFLKYNNIDYSSNLFLSEYFESYEENEILSELIINLGHNNIEDIIMDMELLIPECDKSLNGAFFTPSYIVDFIIEQINPQKSDRILDPSCGSGAFLFGAVLYLNKTYHKKIKECIDENIFGVDILDYNVRRTKVLLILLGLKFGENIEYDDINIKCRDSLRHKYCHSYDVIISNPPYIKFQDLSIENRDFLSNNYITTQNGTYNIFYAFFELGYKLLSEKGKLGFITPNNYFTSLSGKELRYFFNNNKCIYKIVDFDSTLIFDAQTYTSITFINKEKNQTINYSKKSNNEDVNSFLKSSNFTANNYDELQISKWRLLTGNNRYNIDKIENTGSSIGSIFDICCSIATLKDKLFSFIPIKEDTKYYYIAFAEKQFKIEKNVTRSLIKISEMKNEDDICNNNRIIIFPYKKVNGKSEIIQESDFQKEFPFCYEYLLNVKDLLSDRSSKKNIIPFYQYGRSQGLNKQGVKILTPTFSKTPRFMIDYNSNSLFVNGYAIFFKEKQSSLFNHSLSDMKNIDVVVKILNSVIMHFYIKATSVSISGGYPCYQKNFIERFSLPNLTENEIMKIRSINDNKELNDYLIRLYHLNLSDPNLSV